MISETEQQTDNRLLWEFLTKKSRIILLTAFFGAATGAIFTYFIPNDYKSVAVVFPPSAPSIENSIDNPNFGYDVEADRLIQILHSNEVRDSVVKKFNLFEYYTIEKDDPVSIDKLVKEFGNDIRFERAPSMSVILSAQTHSPQLSADILNYILAVTDKVRERIYKQNLRIAYENAQEDYQDQKQRTDSALHVLSNELKENNLNGLVILASNAQLSLDMNKLASKETQAGTLSVGNDIITYKNMTDRLKENESKLLRLKKILETPVPRIFVIDKAEPRYKKVSPSYTVNSALAAALSVVVLLTVLLVKHSREPAKK